MKTPDFFRQTCIRTRCFIRALCVVASFFCTFALPTTSFAYDLSSAYNCGYGGEFPMRFAGCRPGYYYEDWQDADDSLAPDEVGECLECPSGYTCDGGFAGPDNGGGGVTCDEDEIEVNGTCQTAKFSVTTTNGTTEFGFYLSAAGTFYIDWGDGTTETITRTNNTDYTKYEHEYSSAGEYVVRFGGTATGYNADGNPTITFNEEDACYDECDGNWAPNIASISGSLSALFPMLGTADGRHPMFASTFSGATNLTTIPGTLFSDYTTGADYMFSGTFQYCTSLTTIPTGLFSGITTGAGYMFNQTFYSCTSLTTIPSGLFSGITTGADYMFQNTFYGCTSLTTIPTGLFSGITTGAQYMFSGTFYGCTSLTTIPTGLFSGITTGAGGMFSYTFSNCTSLTTIPSGLFSGITTGATYMFQNTFQGCTSLTTIPSNLFSGITTGATYMFQNTFYGCTSLTTIPSNLFSGITTGAQYMFRETFYGCTSLTTIPSNLFSGITTGASSMFRQTFYGCTNLSGYIPPTTFAGLIANGHPTATTMWYNAFTNTQLATSCPTGTTQYITGYEGSGNTTWNGKVSCAEICTAGSTTLRTSTGLIFPLRDEKLTTPALNIKFENGHMCYADLKPGTASNTLNFSVPGGATYHAVSTTAN